VTREPCLLSLPKVSDPRGNLTFIEGMNHVPFEVRRVFYLYDVPGGESRAGHANTRSEQLLIAISGSFDVRVEDGSRTHVFHLNRAYQGLYLPPMVWREIDNFSSGAVCLVLTSTLYSPDDYIRDHDDFLRLRAGA
jgi:glyoxylate utilization-related uncharacterized protein